MKDITRILDKNGRVRQWPVKKETKLIALEYIASKFEHGRFYSEKEINAIIDQWHAFNDHFLIRRELIDFWFFSRTRNGSRYWREERKPATEVYTHS